jgi:hypothetical protein
MIQFLGQQNAAFLRSLLLAACAICIAAHSGCRRAAYTELYIEQLNNESRLLEDRIYEYDSAYRKLELETQSLHHENERLRGQLAAGLSSIPRTSRQSSSSEPSIEFEEIPPLSKAPTPRSSPKEKSPSENLNANPPSSPKESPKVIESDPLEPPKIEIPSQPSILNDGASSTDPVGTSVNYLAVSASKRSPTATENDAVVQAVAIGPAEEQSDESAETIVDEPAETNDQTVFDSQLPTDVDADVDHQQAYTPHLGPAITTTDSSSFEDENFDEQIIELMFHPAFTRAVDADKVVGEESIRMILQPKLASGKIVPSNGHLTVVVVDPYATNGENSDAPVTLGRWIFTPDQLQQYYDPVGSAQGYRFELGPIQGKPTKAELIIFVRLEYEDGRKLVNQFTIHPDSNPTDKPIWTARAKQ